MRTWLFAHEVKLTHQAAHFEPTGCSPSSRINEIMLRLPAALRLCENNSLTRLHNRSRSTSGNRLMDAQLIDQRVRS